MLNRKLYLIILLALISFIGCKKPETTPTFNSAAQAVIDDSLLAQHVRSHNPDAIKTTLGYYYDVNNDQHDSVLQAKVGRIAFLRYTGRLLNDTVFDTNVDAATALIFQVGSGKVIAGLDSAIQNFRKGETGTIYLPSRLGYGTLSQSKIPANSCLIFEVNKLNVE